MHIKKVSIFTKVMMLTLLALCIITLVKLEAKASDIIEVNKDKVWTITFNEKIRFDKAVVDSISVVDNKKNKLNIRVEFGEDEKTILVKPPIREYIEGESYTLNIERGIYSKYSSKRIKERKELTFKVKNHDPFENMIDINSQESISAEPNKTYVFNRVNKLTGINGEKVTDMGWKYSIYKSNKLNNPRIMIYNTENAQEILLPVNLTGWLGVYVGYFSDTEEFKIKHKEKEELFKNYNIINTSTRYINETFIFADDFTGNKISILPVKGKKAKIAYIKLVGLNKEQIELYNSSNEYRRYSRVSYDDDGFTDFFWGRYPDVNGLETLPVNLSQKAGAGELNWTLGTTGLLNYNSKYAGMPFEDFYKFEPYVRNGDKLAKEQILNILSSGKSPLEILTAKSKEEGIKINAALRMDTFYVGNELGFLNGTMYDNYQDYRQQNSHVLSYYYPEFREYILNVLKEAAATENLDGITLDFCRYPNVIGKEATPSEKIQIMNSFMREVRREIPHKKITVRFPYLNPKSYGLDVESWVKEGLVDRIIPSVIVYEEFFNIGEYTQMVKGTDIDLYIAITANLKGKDLTKETEELLEDGKYVPDNEYVSVEEYLYRANEVYEEGADGIILFNTLNHIDLREDLSPKFKLLGDKVKARRWHEFEYPSYLVNYKVDFIS